MLTEMNSISSCHPSHVLSSPFTRTYVVRNPTVMSCTLSLSNTAPQNRKTNRFPNQQHHGTRHPRPPSPAVAFYDVKNVTDAVATVVSAYIIHVSLSSYSRSRHSSRSKTTFYDGYNMVNTISIRMHSSVRAITQNYPVRRFELQVHVRLNPMVRPSASDSLSRPPPPSKSLTQVKSSVSL